MADMATVENSVKFLSQFTKDIVILHCTSVYPCKPHQLNLRCVETYLDKYALHRGASGPHV
jgi:sialic acid synthase SpsE